MQQIRTALVLCLCAIACAGAQNFLLQPLKQAEIQLMNAKLDQGLLPEGAVHFQVIGPQSFRVQAQGHTELTLVPVRFSLSQPGLVAGMNRDTNLCGVYLMDASGKSRFEKLSDSDTEGLIQCNGIEGVGLAQSAGSHPDVIVIFGSYTVHRSWSDPYLVAWSENDGRYVMQSISVPEGAKPANKLTIAQVRKWLNRSK